MQLEKDGILNDNQDLPLPRLLRRIAVVSSATAAGYGDFCNQLEQNDYGFHFDVKLFPAIMQGEQVPESIINALEEIVAASAERSFDLVVIIRGGGASSDLSDFDSYELAACIAQYPLPVLTGIGHERDETVLDFVAHTRVKTPTAAAAFIIDHQAGEAASLDELYQRKQRLEHQKAVLPLLFMGFYQKQQNKLELLAQRLTSTAGQRLEREPGRLQLLYQRLVTNSTQHIEREKYRYQFMRQRFDSLDPRLLLKRGYTITTLGGKVVRSIEGLTEGDILTTNTENGEIYSKVVLCKKN